MGKFGIISIIDEIEEAFDVDSYMAYLSNLIEECQERYNKAKEQQRAKSSEQRAVDFE